MSNILPTNRDSIYQGLKTLSELDRNAIVRPDNPPSGIAGFLFDIPEEDTVELQSDITDHYIENNSAIQDHIALRPEKVILRGLVGEIAQTEDQVAEFVKKPVSLPPNPELDPEFTDVQTASMAYRDREQAAADAAASGQQLQMQQGLNTQELPQIVSTGVDQSLYGVFNNLYPKLPTRQSQVFAYFYQLWKGRQLFTLDTPWGFLTDMAIESLRASQEETTKYLTDFSITFKKIRFANAIVVSAGQLAGRCADQSAPWTNNGVVNKDPVNDTKNVSVLKRLHLATVNFLNR